ncbi:MAG: YezD family protein [Candidatus Omnitrophica bacterium]|nr:YezD family protein [Candidatus Omnitrophota bacterium]
MSQKKEDLEQEIINEILKSIKDVKFGEVLITIHNSKVVQIDKKEKKRFG